MNVGCVNFEQLNKRIGEIFKNTALTDEEKRKARIALLKESDAFELFAEFLKSKSKSPYNFTDDPSGLTILRRLTDVLASSEPLLHAFPEQISDANLDDAVKVVIDQYQHLIEYRGYWRELWEKDKPKKEAAAQRLFFAVAFAYLEAHKIDMNAETDIGGGFIDFKASVGTERIVIEIKKSNNPKLIQGLENQLLEYCKAEKTTRGYYVVIDVSADKKKADWQNKLLEEKKRLNQLNGTSLEVVIVDAQRRAAPSKR